MAEEQSRKVWNKMDWTKIRQKIIGLMDKPMNYSFVGAYKLPDRIVVHSYSKTKTGILRTSEPCIVLKNNVSNLEIGEGIQVAKKGYKTGVPDMVRYSNSWAEVDKPIFKACNLKSWKKIQELSSHCYIEFCENEIVFTPTRNGGTKGDTKGFHPIEEKRKKLNLNANLDEIGKTLIDCFNLCAS